MAPGDPSRDLSKYRPAGFDRGASAVKEALWLGVRWVFFLTILPWPSAWRAMLLRLFGARVGSGVVIRGNVNITFPWRLTLGDHVWLGEEVMILSLAPVTIGDSVCVSQRAFLCTGSHDYGEPAFGLITGPISIGRGAWIAAQSFIGPDTVVGEGSVVAAGAIVTKSLAAHVLVAGNPARVIRELREP